MYVRPGSMNHSPSQNSVYKSTMYQDLISDADGIARAYNRESKVDF